MIPKAILEKAVAGGWNEDIIKVGRHYPDCCIVFKSNLKETGVETLSINFRDVVVDPLFWQSLFPIGECHCGKDGHALNSVNCPADQWRYRAHDFYNLILTGKPTDDFWRELLSHPTNV